MKVYDCFTFYNEFELLELRLKALWDVVDHFVIVEANRKHNGEPKDFNFPKRAEEFKEFWSKIRYVNADLSNVPFKGVGDWSIEHAQRDAILNGINDAQAEDFIFISDADEFPPFDILQLIYTNRVPVFVNHILPPLANGKRLSLMCNSSVKTTDLLEHCPLTMAQTFHYYYFDYICNGLCECTIITKRKNLTTPQGLRQFVKHWPRIAVGHHLSYMGGVDRVINKMKSIVEGNEFVARSGGKVIDRKHVEESIAKGTDIYGRKGIPESQFYPYDAKNIRLPHLNEFLRKYPHFLREPEKYFTN